MANYREIFPNEHTIIPVVHIVNEEQILRNVQIAQDEGCDGAFLISMNLLRFRKVLELYDIASKTFPDFWLGVNLLDVHSMDLFSFIDSRVKGVWRDDTGITDTSTEVFAQAVLEKRLSSGWNGLDFGGIAFKYQEHVSDVGLAAKKATKYMDVITTSGTKTGRPPRVEKVRAMKEAMGDFPLAIASGISPNNVGDYLGYSDCYLVASSLLISGTEEFDPREVRRLVRAVKG